MGSVSWLVAMLLLLHVMSTQKPTAKKRAVIPAEPATLPEVKSPKKPTKKEKRATK